MSWLWYFGGVEVIPISVAEFRVAPLVVVGPEPLQFVVVVDVFFPFLLRSVGAGEINHQGLLVERLHAFVPLVVAVAVVVALEVGDVFEQQVAAEDVVEGDGVFWVGVEQLHHHEV